MEYIENVTGKNININNSNGDNINSAALLGDSSQKTYTGKNLLKIPLSTSRTFNSITYTVNADGSIYIKGTASQAGGFYVDLDTPIELDGIYTFSLKCVGTTNATGNQQWLLRQSDNTTVYSPTIISNDTRYNSGEKHTTISKLQIYTAANAVIDMTVYPQLEKNSTYTEWEQYVGGVASPNPDYPQDVEIIKGITNLYNPGFRNTDGNIMCASGTATEQDGEFTLTASGTDLYIWNVIASGSNYNYSAGQLFEFEDDDTYWFSINNSKFTKTYITYYDSNKKSLGAVNKSSRIFSFSRKDKAGAKYFTIRIGYGSATSGQTYKFKLQLTKSERLYLHNDLKYGEYPQLIEKCGKNVLNLNNVVINNITGLTTTVKNNIVYLNGTNTAAGYIIGGRAYTDTFLSAGTYKFSIRALSGTMQRIANAAFVIKNYNDNTIYSSIGLGDMESHGGLWYNTFTLPKDTQISFEIYINGTITFNDFEVGVQIEKGSGVTDFENYQGRKYFVNLTKDNLFENHSTINTASINNSGVIVTDANSSLHYIPVESGKNYTVYNNTPRQFVISYSQTEPELNLQCYPRVVYTDKKYLHLTIPSGYKYLIIRNYPSIPENNNNLIVTEGNSITEELCKIGNYQDEIRKSTGKNLFDGDIVSGRWNIAVGTVIDSNSQFGFRSENAIDIESSTTYTLSATFVNGAVYIVETDEDDKILAIDGNNGYKEFTYTSGVRSNMVFTSHANAKHLYWYAAGAGATTPPTDFMAEVGSSVSPYEPYGKIWYVHKEVGKVVLDGSEYWGSNVEGFTLSQNSWNTLTDNNCLDKSPLITTNFINYTTWSELQTHDYGVGILYSGIKNFYMRDTDISSTADFKTWLSNNNQTVYYVLTTPVNIEITDAEEIRQLNELYSMDLPYGTTYIDSYGNLPVILDINYNNWNKDINPTDRAALLDGTATIESEIEIHNSNLFDKNYYSLINGYMQGSTGKILSSNGDYIVYVPCKPNTKYTIHKTMTTPSNSNRFRIGSSNNIPTINTVLDNFVYSDDMDLYEDTYTYTTSLNANYLSLYFYTTANSPDKTLSQLLNSIVIEEGVSYTLNQNNSLISWNHEDFRYVKDEGFIGQFVARQLTGELKDLDDDFNITDKILHLKLGVRTNDNTNWYSLGNFLVSKVTDDEVNDKTSFEALDYTKKFNQLYRDMITYPCTAGELAQNVCEQVGVELATPCFKNYDYIIQGNVFNNNETCRDVMKAIGKLAFSWVRVDWDNKVYLDFSKEVIVNQYNTANNSNYYNLKTQKEMFGPVNRIIIGYSQIEGERTKIEDTTSIETNGVSELTIYDNPLVYTQEQRENIINSASDLLGLEYMPLNTLTVGHPWLKGKELFEVTDMEGNKYNTLPFDRTIQYFGHIKTLIDVATETKTNTEYAYEANIGKGLMQTEIKVDKVTGDITSLTSRTETLEDDMGNVYTIEQTNQLIQNAQTGLTNTFSEAGGNNIFRNTGLWFEQSDSVTKIGKNLFDKNTVDRGYYINQSGENVESEGWYISNYISVEPNTTYTINASQTSLGNLPSTVFYDMDKTYLSGMRHNGTTALTFTTPSDCHYLKTSGSIVNIASFQLEQGSTATSYEPYYTYTNDYEFWEGPVVKQKEESAANLNALLLQLGDLSQEQVVPNGNYTISFKYKKLINLANVKCYINDIAYALTSTTDTEFVQTIEVNSQHINIKFTSNIANSCEIHDLMVNAGQVKLAYSQNQNETTTDTVNISKGITITSTDTDTTFKANADGIRTLDRNGNELTKFTDTGMTTKESIIEDEAQIVGVLIQSIGNQTWFTRL